MEHFYDRIDGFMNHRNTVMLDHVIQTFPKNGCWVELGSWTGRSAAYCAVELITRDWHGSFYCVDSWSGGQELANNPALATVRDTFISNTKPIQHVIEMRECLSWEAAQEFSPGTVDFCYVDAGHDYDSVTRDLTAWWPCIKSGAWFGGDDYTKGYPALQQAVWDFFKPQNIRVSRMGRCWLVRKP
jgi:hypothetical protein